MKFTSTRDSAENVSFTEAMFRGLAPDGGLYRPEETPDLSAFFSGLPEDIPFNELCSDLTAAILGPEIDKPTAQEIVASAFDFEPEITTPADGISILELFHGPSCAFKDYGASFLASAMDRLLACRDERAIIVTATSGDTGSAVAQAFHGKENIDVVILYPSGRVSPLQEKQLTTLGDNITALEVSGNFDDCQRMAKAAFTDPALTGLPLSSANSINIGRLIPQSFYYVWAWTRLRKNGNFAFVVPSGNFGNITAGLYASAWGLPAKRFVAVTNANDVIPEYLQSGKYNPRPSVVTYSNAMDVGAPSNFERLDSLYNHNVDIFRKHVEAVSVSNEVTMQTIGRVFSQNNYLCCPHTAVGWRGAEIYRIENPETPTLVLSTAHPGKFIEVVEKATGEKPSLPSELSRLLDRKKVSIELGNKNEDLKNWLLERYGH